MPDGEYLGAIGEANPDPEDKVHQCLSWIRSEFPSSDNDELHGGRMIAESPDGHPIIEVQHTKDEPRPGIIEGIAVESGCEVTGELRMYRSEFDAVETLLWIVPEEYADEYDEDRMKQMSESWQQGAHLENYVRTRDAVKGAVWATVCSIALIVLNVLFELFAPGSGILVTVMFLFGKAGLVLGALLTALTWSWAGYLWWSRR